MISAQNHLPLLNGNNLIARVRFLPVQHRKLVLNKCTQWFLHLGILLFFLLDSAVEARPSVTKNRIESLTNPLQCLKRDVRDCRGLYNHFSLSSLPYTTQADSMLEVLLLIPLNSDEVAQPTTSRFVNYYAGMLMALSNLQDEGIEISMTVVDTEENGVDLSKMKDLIRSMKPDLVIGPYKKEDIQELARLCKDLQIPLVSPWHTSSKITTENPYYIQMKPNLKQHFTKLVEACLQEFGKNEVTVIGVESEDFKTWCDFLQKKALDEFGMDSYFSFYPVNKDSIMKGPTAFSRFLKKQKPKAVLIPNYSFKDEQIVYQMLKRLSSEKGELPLTVFGMPVILESDKIEFDQYHLLDMRVVVSDFVDDREAEVRNFRRKYFEKYGEIPTSEAVKGYDLMVFLGRNLAGFGHDFARNILDQPTTFLQSTFQLKETLSDQDSDAERQVQFDFFENKHLDIVEFKDKRWQRKFN